MKTWPDTDGSAIARYLRHPRLRSPITHTYYRQALRGFQEVAARRPCSPRQVSRDALETWLRERAAHWPMSTLLHRAQIVNRFLDFLVHEGSIASNPVTDLCAQYCVKRRATCCCGRGSGRRRPMLGSRCRMALAKARASRSHSAT